MVHVYAGLRNVYVVSELRCAACGTGRRRAVVSPAWRDGHVGLGRPQHPSVIWPQYGGVVKYQSRAVNVAAMGLMIEVLHLK